MKNKKRSAKPSRQQCVSLLADNSGSMYGDKANAATQGLQEMIMECQSRCGSGPESSCYEVLVIKFDSTAQVFPNCDMVPVRQIDPMSLKICGDGSSTNIRAGLELCYERIDAYLKSIQVHPEIDRHPVPLVILFSDGMHNMGPGPQAIAEKIKGLAIGEDHVVIAAAGVAMEGSEPDEKTLMEIASPDCYVRITDSEMLIKFLAVAGSAQVSNAKDIAELIRSLDQ